MFLVANQGEQHIFFSNHKISTFSQKKKKKKKKKTNKKKKKKKKTKLQALWNDKIQWQLKFHFHSVFCSVFSSVFKKKKNPENFDNFKMSHNF